MTLDNLYTFDDPMGDFLHFDGDGGHEPASFGISAWTPSSSGYESDDFDEDDEDDSARDNLCYRWRSSPSKPQEKPRGSTAAALPTCSGDSTQMDASTSCPIAKCLRITRVRFLEVPEIRLYEGVDKEQLGALFYSCHELQKMIDEAKKENEAKTTL
jgi:hypothetical protein